MAKKLYEESNIQAIADAIRAKNGEATKYKPSEMAAAIAAITTGGGGSMSIVEGIITPATATQEIRIPWEKETLPLFWLCVRQDFDTYVTPDNPATEPVLGGVIFFSFGYVRASSSKTTRYIALKIHATTGYTGYVGGHIDYTQDILNADGLLAYSNGSAYKWQPNVTYKYYIFE